MKINDLFKKDINRNIQGVVKIGQDSKEIIKNELEEYVITKELKKHFDNFFENYKKAINSPTDKIGVWISGFFGSGKSHFLKILSYLLSNDLYNEQRAVDYFKSKLKDEKLLLNMEDANSISADVILFNIDAKADSDSKSKKDAIVNVFMKVFNEMQGFCASMPWIAELERQMVKEGVYEDFKEKFKEISGLCWIEGRENFYFEEDSIIEALSKTTKMREESAKSWFERAEKDYSLNIEQFAKKVNDYIKKKGDNHHVIFLCDEIGQYIGNDNNLMLNLQTVVENLGNECNGKAWVIATSQQDIDSVAKAINRDNFSKIIGRFDTKLSLSSANVDEVIKKRLLEKTDIAKDKLKLLYNDKNAIIKNLLTFSPDTPEKKLYKDENEFIDVYPFIPYQFNLLQSVFTGIRTHGASGKHLSEGERSLLSAFQEAAKKYETLEDGILIPFQAFYETIETFLDHNIKIVITHAEENENLNDFDVEVLKVLFMIKYVETLPSNIENISTIMIENIDQDKIEMKKNIDDSLKRLERERLIIKNGNEYIFLTNEEQDVNREIREIKIDPSEIQDKIGEDIFSILFGTNKKYRFNDRYDFSFNSLVDDKARGTQKEEFGVNVLTPYNPYGNNLSYQELISMSIRQQNIIVSLPDEYSYIEEMEQALQIDQYIRKNAGKTAIDEIEVIKSSKTRESQKRKERSRSLLEGCLRKADIYLNGKRMDIKEKAPNERINEAFKDFIEVIYNKLNYITKPFNSMDDLKKVLTSNDNAQITMDGVVSDNALAIEEVNRHIELSNNKNIQTTVKTLLEHFNKIPYGWKDIDIQGLLLILYKKQSIKFELAGEAVAQNDSNLINYVTKRDYLDRVVVKIRNKVGMKVLTNAKQLAKDLFGSFNMPNDEEGIMEKFKELCIKELSGVELNINEMLIECRGKDYPGNTILLNGKKVFEEIIKINNVEDFYSFLEEKEDKLLDYKEDVSDIKNFFKSQRQIFDKALDMLKIYEGNGSYVDDIEINNTIGEIKKIVKMERPYALINKLPDFSEKFMRSFESVLDMECKLVKGDIERDFKAVCEEFKRKELFEKYCEEIETGFNNLLKRLDNLNSIPEAISKREESSRLKIRLLNKIDDEGKKKIGQDKVDPGEGNITPPIQVKKCKNISAKTLFSGVTEFTSKDDIDKFLSDLKIRLEEELEENSTIRII